MLKSKEITITTEGRDKGKRFTVVEMPARIADRWARHVGSAICASGQFGQAEQLLAMIALNGLEAIANVGLVALLAAPPEQMDPLWDEMLNRCVAFHPGPTGVYRGAPIPGATPPTGALLESDIEEALTLNILRGEVFELHTGFSYAAHLSQIFQKLREVLGKPTTTDLSAEPSASPSPPGSRPSLN